MAYHNLMCSRQAINYILCRKQVCLITSALIFFVQIIYISYYKILINLLLNHCFLVYVVSLDIFILKEAHCPKKVNSCFTIYVLYTIVMLFFNIRKNCFESTLLMLQFFLFKLLPLFIKDIIMATVTLKLNAQRWSKLL